MKPAVFDYVRADNLAHALETLAQAGDEAKVIAGGQSLVPMMNFRLLQPSILVDVNGIGELAFLEDDANHIRIGALTRHRRLETDPIVARRLPVLHAAMPYVAHLAIRNRGTIGGSLSHADPAAELPMLALLLDAELNIRSLSGQRRTKVGDFLVSALTTDLEPDELLTDIVIPAPPADAGWDVQELARRSGDFALVAVAALLTRDGDAIVEARLALMGIGDTAMRVRAAEDMLRGRRFDTALAAAAADAVQQAIDPPNDLHASAEYRRHLAGVLTHRALANAWARAGMDAQ